MSAAPLTAETYARVEAHLDAALDLPAAERAAFVDALELEEPLRELLRQLLARATDDDPLEQAPSALAASLLQAGAESEHSGATLGGYRLIELIGEGGMATVWRAQRVDGSIARPVALKCLKTGLATPRLRERFLREQRVLALLEHPYIARLYDVGVGDNGVPFIAMELVDGLPITRFADQAQLDVEARLRLFRKVIEAVAHAHAKLIVHRDLKPANILVTADGTPKLLDFGIAKPLDELDDTTQTHFRALTPEYAAPEQFSGRGIGTATDIYGLGATLFELLTRRRPQRPRSEMIALAEGDTGVTANMVAPSTAALQEITENAVGHGAAPLTRLQRQRLHVHLKGELDTLVLKAMQPEPARRYRSATELDDDIARYLAGLPLRAQPDSVTYRARKFMGRHAAPVALTALAIVSLIGITAVAVNRAQAARSEAQRAAAVQAFLLDVFEAAQTDARGNAVLTTREMVDNAAAQLDRGVLDPGATPELNLAVGRVYRKLGLSDRAIELLRRAAEGKVAQGNDPRGLAIARQALGNALNDALRFTEAERELTAALSWFSAAPNTASEQLQTLDALFSSVYYQARLDQAAELSARALKILDAHPEQSPQTHVVALLNHAVALRGLGRLDEALASAERAVKMAERESDPKQRDLSRALSTLGTLQRRAGRCVDAVATLRRTADLDMQRDREADATHQHNLARALLCTGDYAEAVTVARLALTQAETAMGRDHPELGQYREALGLALDGHGQTREAETELRAALADFERGYAENSPNMRRKRQTLANFLLDHGHADEARALFEASLAGLDARQKPELEVRCVGRVGLARIALGEGDLATARVALAEAAETARAHGQLESDNQLELMLAQAELADAESPGAIALSAFEAAADYARLRFGERHPNLARVLEAQARATRRAGDVDAANALLARADAIYALRGDARDPRRARIAAARDGAPR